MANRLFDDALRTKLRKLIEENSMTTAGIVICLAWDAGLMRNELHSLRWEQVDFTNGVLRLPDRNVPITEELERHLQQWKAEHADSPYVVVNSKSGTQPLPPAISRLVRRALAHANIEELRLIDLRHDYILRQYAALDHTQAAMVTGMPLATYRLLVKEPKPSIVPPAPLPVAPMYTGESLAAREDGKWTALDADVSKTLEGLLLSEPYSVVGVILRLAWRAGLLRDEIYNLRWDQVDFSGKALHLPDREVPMVQDLERCLRQWQLLYGQYGPFVVVSEQRRARMAPQSLSRIARVALDSVGLQSIRLADLRYDYTLRQFESEGWKQALRNTGLGLHTYLSNYCKIVQSSAKPSEKHSASPQSEEIQAEKLRAVLKNNSNTSIGIALWLSHDAGLLYQEITALTWDEVDLANGVLHLDDKDVPLSSDLTAILRQYKKEQQPADDPHVLLLPNSRKPIPKDYLSRQLRNLLVQNGIDLTLHSANRNIGASKFRDDILNYVAQNGSTTCRSYAQLSQRPKSAVLKQLNALVKDGLLEYSHGIYFPPGTGSVADQREAAVRSYLMQHGPSSVATLAETMRLSKSTILRILTPMIQRGELTVRRDKSMRSGFQSLYSLNAPDHEHKEASADLIDK